MLCSFVFNKKNKNYLFLHLKPPHEPAFPFTHRFIPAWLIPNVLAARFYDSHSFMTLSVLGSTCKTGFDNTLFLPDPASPNLQCFLFLFNIAFSIFSL